MRIERRTVELTEGYLSRYEVDALAIFIGNDEVIVDPVGALMIGSSGRVDMSGPRRVSRIVLLEKSGPVRKITIHGTNGPEESSTRPSLRGEIPQRGWYWVTSPPNATATPLDAESFKSAIMYVASSHGA